ncbi:MAG: family 10 glycosylhydrolase [candidate division Zixibacteria bacterium]|nr:family 10 glycosylhydrolase [candidate division Zixibacteria bacterium]
MLVLTAPASAVADDPRAQVRALWVTTESLYNRGEIERLVATAAAYDVDALFVQVRRAGDAYYKSATEPRSRKLEGQAETFDPLAEVIAAARLFDIEVHAWLNVAYVWPGPEMPPMADHVAHRRPEWVTVGRDGRRMTRYSKREMARADAEGWYVDPAEAAFADYFAAVAAEVAREYDVDGVHLDFIRYPNYRFGYGKKARTAYLQERGGQDPILLGYHKLGEDVFRPAVGYEGLTERWFDLHTLEWLEWRASRVTRVAAAAREAVKVADAETQFSAALWADPEHAYRYVGQDWLGWLEGGLVDIVCPMTYWGDAARLAGLARRLRERRGDARLYVGVGAFNHDASYTAAIAAGLADAPVDGIIIFDYGSCWRKPAALPTLAAVVHGEPAICE